MRDTYFNKLVDLMAGRMDTSKVNDPWSAMFKKYIEDCHPFMFTIQKEASQDVPSHSEYVDLPYPIICVESVKGHLTIPNPRDSTKRVWICALVAKEIGPKEYEFFALIEFERDGERVTGVVDVNRSKDKAEEWASFNGLLKYYLDRLSREKMGSLKRENKIKLGTGKNKFFWRPKNVTVITPVKYVSDLEAVEGFKDIDWSHRWEVRGHWREVSGIGKDREGDYTQTGFTWVKNHVKGPEDKPIMKKTYVVGE